jgi:hypothetical protein
LHGHESSWGTGSKKSIVMGSVVRGGHLDKIMDPLNALSQRNSLPYKVTNEESSANLEYSVHANIQRKEQKNKLKSDLQYFIKQEE